MMISIIWYQKMDSSGFHAARRYVERMSWGLILNYSIFIGM